MATPSSLGITFATTGGNETVVATPALNDLIVVIAAHSGRTTAQAPAITDNNAGGNGTYTQVASCTKNTSADSMWAFVRNGLIASATSTTFTDTIASDTGGGLQVFKITGMAMFGGAALRQKATQDNQAAAGTPTPVLAAAALTGNPLIGAVFNASNPAGMTARSSPAWTESQDVGYITPTTGLETMFIASGETGTSIAWGGTSASAFCSMVLEFNIALYNDVFQSNYQAFSWPNF